MMGAVQKNIQCIKNIFKLIIGIPPGTIINVISTSILHPWLTYSKYSGIINYKQLMNIFAAQPRTTSTELPEVLQHSKNVWCVLGDNPGFFTLQGTNVYLVGSGSRDRILIDAGQGSSARFVQNVRSLLKEEKTNINRVIITHWHLDHVGGLKDLIPVFKEMNDGKLPYVFKFPTSENDYELFSIPSEYPFEELEAGHIFKTEGATLKIFHTPGHTTDHAMIQFLEENSLFCGDAMMGEGTGIFEDLYDYMKSLELMLKLKAERIYSGHGPVVTDPEATIKANLNHLIARENKVLQCFENGKKSRLSLSEIVAGVFPGATASMGGQGKAEHHLKKLVREGKVWQGRSGRYSLHRSFHVH